MAMYHHLGHRIIRPGKPTEFGSGGESLLRLLSVEPPMIPFFFGRGIERHVDIFIHALRHSSEGIELIGSDRTSTAGKRAH